MLLFLSVLRNLDLNFHADCQLNGITERRVGEVPQR